MDAVGLTDARGLAVRSGLQLAEPAGPSPMYGCGFHHVARGFWLTTVYAMRLISAARSLYAPAFHRRQAHPNHVRAVFRKQAQEIRGPLLVRLHPRVAAERERRPAIYKEIAVTEVWRFVSGQKLIFEQLQPDGSYTAVEESQFLRIRPDEVLRWVNEAATERPAVWNRRLNEWAMGLSRQAQEPKPA